MVRREKVVQVRIQLALACMFVLLLGCSLVIPTIPSPTVVSQSPLPPTPTPTPTPTPVPYPANETPIPFETIEKLSDTGVGIAKYNETGAEKAPRFILLTQAADVEKLDGLVSTKALEKVRELDFAKDWAVAVFSGVKPSNGYDAEIVRVISKDGQVIVEAALMDPPPGIQVGAEETLPYHIIYLKKEGLIGTKSFPFEANGEVIQHMEVDLDQPITESAPPTAIPFPTITPLPTPTRKPGATATPMPLPTPAKSPKGFIWYSTKDESTNLFSHFTLEMSEAGSAKGPPAPVSLPPGRSTELASKAVAIDPSPDQRFLALLVPSEPGEKAYVVDLSLMEVREPLSGFASGMFLGWHPNGRQFLYFVDGGGPWLVDAETSEVTMLVLEYLVQGGAISPDGSLVAYIASGWPEDSLWLVSSAGSDARYQFNTGPQSRLYPASWSPDGTKLVYYGSCDTPKPEETPSSPLCLFDIKAGRRTALKISSFAGGNITWSPDGRYIAVTGYSTKEEPCAIDPGMTPPEQERCFYMGRVIFIEDVNSGEVRELTEGTFPVWSPDGSMIAFLSIRSGSPEVWSIRVKDGDLRRLTSDGRSKGYELVWR